MEVLFDGLRVDDAPGEIKVVGWGNMAQELQNQIQIGQKLVLEGRLRMNSISRQDGTKEKRAEFTLSKFHPLTAIPSKPNNDHLTEPSDPPQAFSSSEKTLEQGNQKKSSEELVNWDSSPLVPNTDEIPF